MIDIEFIYKPPRGQVLNLDKGNMNFKKKIYLIQMKNVTLLEVEYFSYFIPFIRIFPSKIQLTVQYSKKNSKTVSLWKTRPSGLLTTKPGTKKRAEEFYAAQEQRRELKNSTLHSL